MEQQVDRLQVGAEGVVALPRSLASRLDLHRMNPRRGPRSEPRPVGFGRGDFHLPEGWEAPMSDGEVDDFLNGR